MTNIEHIIAKPKPKLRELWPTIFNAAQLAFPWGSGKRLRKRRSDAKEPKHAGTQRPPAQP